MYKRGQGSFVNAFILTCFINRKHRDVRLQVFWSVGSDKDKSIFLALFMNIAHVNFMNYCSACCYEHDNNAIYWKISILQP
jgi:hypothetical protein